MEWVWFARSSYLKLWPHSQPFSSNYCCHSLNLVGIATHLTRFEKWFFHHRSICFMCSFFFLLPWTRLNPVGWFYNLKFQLVAACGTSFIISISISFRLGKSVCIHFKTERKCHIFDIQLYQMPSFESGPMYYYFINSDWSFSDFRPLSLSPVLLRSGAKVTHLLLSLKLLLAAINS